MARKTVRITREELRAFRAGRREAAALRARARQAQLRAAESGLICDRDAAVRAAARYEEEAVRREAALLRIERGIEELPHPEQREAMRLRYCDGYGMERLAARLHVSVPTAARILRRAEKKITGDG